MAYSAVGTYGYGWYYYYDTRRNRLGALRPGRVKIGSDPTSLATAEDLRKAVNVWGDTSFDDELLRLSNVAADHIESYIERPIGTAVTIDLYYPEPAKRLLLASTYEIGSFAVANVGSNQSQALELDDTGPVPTATMTESQINTFKDQIDGLASEKANPFHVLMNTSNTPRAGQYAIREAHMKMVAHLFYTRPGSGGYVDSHTTFATRFGFLTPALYAEVMRLLDPYRDNVGIGHKHDTDLSFEVY